MRLLIKLAFASLIAGTALSTIAHAQTRSDLPYRVNELEGDVRRLERIVDDLRDRLDRLDRGGRPVPPPFKVVHACLVTDTGYKRTFVATASTRLMAENDARNACGNATHPSYCASQDIVRCDSNIEQGGKRSVCVVIDSGYKRSFTGEGATAIEAEAKAKQSCESATHASYCGSVKARCETLP